MDKLLTVIIPSYNMEAYLPRCQDSLNLDENHKLPQVIVVNDGSIDSTSAIAHSYCERFPDAIHIIDKSNGNYGTCVNAAVSVSKGKYVKILDADDTRG